MPEKDITNRLDFQVPNGRNRFEHLFRSEVPDLPAVKLNIRSFSTPPTSEVLRAVKDQLNITVYSPEPDTQEAQEFIGGYHITCTNPKSEIAKRVGIVARRQFTGHTFNDSYSHVGFQNYPERPDIFTGTITEAKEIPNSESTKYQVVCYKQFGALLPLQLSETYSLNSSIEKQLASMVNKFDSKTKNLLQWTRTPFVISNPKYDTPIKINLDLGLNLSINDIQVELPATRAVVAFINPHNNEVIAENLPIKIPKISNTDNASMKNYAFGGWAPSEPPFMKDKVEE